MKQPRHLAKLESPSLRLGLGLTLTGGGFRDTWQTAWDAAYAGLGTTRLENWFISNTGPRVSVASALSGTQTITTQAQADALSGKTITGSVVVTAAENIDLCDFKVVSTALVRANSDHKTLLFFNSTGFDVYAHHIELDGLGYTGAQGTGGDTFADHITMRYINIHGCGFDGMRMYKNTTAEYNYIHDLPNYDSGGYDDYRVDDDQDLWPHQDGVQPQRSGNIFRYNWCKNNTGSSATSVLLLLTDVDIITAFTAQYNYFAGGHARALIVNTESGSISDPGIFGYPSGCNISNNIIQRDYLNYPGSMWSVGGLPSGVREDTGIKLLVASGNKFDDGSTASAVDATATPQFYDSFTDTTSQTLDNHIPEWGTGWALMTGLAPSTKCKFDSSGRLYAPASSNAWRMTKAASSGDYTVSAYWEKLSTVSSDNVEICARMQSGANTLYGFRWVESALQWSLFKVVAAGAATLIGTAFSDTFAVGRIARVRLIVSGTSLTGVVDGVSVCTGTDSDILTGTPGSPGVRFFSTQTSSQGIHMYNIVSV